ncbi:hypothetical protein [Cohnella sp. GCM10012308]|uniref:hypothetical protein n=1 Tax=Cohnella sp. GCM10012308 TaxID=3317329 RepID=UPI003608AD17
MTNFSYMLRYALQPGHREEERLEALVAFCREGHIDDVMFFIEPMNLNHTRMEEARPWMETIAKAKARLDLIGVTTSINPLNTLLHDAAGNRLSEDLNFQLMVDPQGTSSSVVACPLCPEWRSYIAEMYAYYATLKPYSLWIEDDFRFHNHGPLEWGGCFCDAHLREFARMAGLTSIGREAFVAGLLAGGEPHEYRRIWLDSCRQTLVDVAKLIADAVHRVSPDTRMGLMTSMPSVHAAEGRDWHALIEALGGARHALVRPHLPAYRETSGMQYAWLFQEVSMLTAAYLPPHSELRPELENVPYTSFSKSKTFQKYQVETSLLLGSQGITLNIVDMAGNGLYPEERAELWLSEEKTFLDAAASLDLSMDQMEGVQVLVNERSAYRLHTSSPCHMEALYPAEAFWSGLLSAFGIANKYAVNRPESNGAIALSGQSLRNYGEAEIRALFAAHAVLLEGDAVDTLCAMGLGSLCGAKQASWTELQTCEQIVDGREYAGTREGRMRPYLTLGRFLNVEYEEDASIEIVSDIRTVQGVRVCAGMTIVDGRIFILPYGQRQPEGLLNPIRRAVIQEVLAAMPGRRPLTIASYAPHVSVFEYRSGRRQAIALVNHSLDEVDEIALAGADLTGEAWRFFSRDVPSGRPIPLRSHADRTIVQGRLAPLSLTLLVRNGEPGIGK